MMKPASYPFLALARKYGYPYGDVLSAAGELRRNHGYFDPDGPNAHWIRRGIAAREVFRAFVEQDAIRRGAIDWQTGEPVPVDVFAPLPPRPPLPALLDARHWAVRHDNGKRWRIEAQGFSLQPVGSITAGEAEAICVAVVVAMRKDFK